MMTLVIAGFQALLAEIVGVSVMALVLYIYWNAMTRTK